MSMKTILLASTIAVLPAVTAVAQMVEPPAENGADTAPYIRSALPLDEPRHLCIDLPGHGDRINLEAPFTVHTCKDGLWNYDQRFTLSDDGTELQMPQYSKCLAANPVVAGANIVLADCGTDAAKWTMQNARLKHAQDSSLCVTIADTKSELTPGGKRFPQRYRARTVSLEACDDANLERQLWSVTQPLDLEAPLLPPAGSLPVD